jgi:hypothetical protein
MDENQDKWSKKKVVAKQPVGTRAEDPFSLAEVLFKKGRVGNGEKGKIRGDENTASGSDIAREVGLGPTAAASGFKRKLVVDRPFDYFTAWDKVEFLRQFGFVKQVNQRPFRPLDELCEGKINLDHISKWVLLSDHIFFATSVNTPNAVAFALVTRCQGEQGTHLKRTAYISTFCSTLRKDLDGGQWASKNFMFRVLASLKRLGYGDVMLLPFQTPSVILFYTTCGFRQKPRSEYMHAKLKDFHEPARLDVAKTIEEAMVTQESLNQQSRLISDQQQRRQLAALKGSVAVKGSSDPAANALNLVITSFRERFPDFEQVRSVQRAWKFTYDQLPTPETLMTERYEQQGIQLHKLKSNENILDVCPGKDRKLLGVVIFNADDERSMYVYLYKNRERKAITVKLEPKKFMLLTMYKPNIKSKMPQRPTNTYTVRRSTKGDTKLKNAQADGDAQAKQSEQVNFVQYCVSYARPDAQ